jgi:MoxR-like ATPase
MANSTITITLTDSQGRSDSMELETGQYLIGRGSDCQICVAATFKSVSRRHARLTVRPDGARIEDLGSRSGMTVNGEIVQSQKLEDGDFVRLGGELGIRVHLPEQARKESSPKMMFDGAKASAQDIAGALHDISQATDRLFAEVHKRIVGQNEIIACVWAAILARGHCLLVGVPGLAKTLLVSTLSDVLQLKFSRIQFTPDLMPSDIIGSQILSRDAEGEAGLRFEPGPIFSQLLLADEINRTPPKTQAALLQAMQERQVTVSRNDYNLGPPFCVVATQNPIEQEGTYPLPEAQQDRFMFSLILDYPDRHEEIEVLTRLAADIRHDVGTVLTAEDILRFQAAVDQIAVPAELISAIADTVRATRPADPNSPELVREVVDWGAGPRAGQALLTGAKALAAMAGRPAAGWEDVRRIVKPVLRHRIGLNYRARGRGVTADDVIEAAVSRLEK